MILLFSSETRSEFMMLVKLFNFINEKKLSEKVVKEKFILFSLFSLASLLSIEKKDYFFIYYSCIML